MREQFLNRIDGIIALDKLKTQEFSEEHMDYVYNIVPQKRDNMILQGGKEFCDELAAREKAREVKSRKRLLKMTLSGTSLGCLTKQNIFRQWCARLVCSRPFELCTYVFIATSCVSLAMMSPDHMDKVRPDDPSSFWSGLFWLDVVTTIIFDLEMLLRIVAMGLYFGEDTYLSDGWNVLDFVVNICSTVDQASPSSNLGFFKALRAIRCLRALRLVSRNPGMRMVVNSILQSLPVAVNVVAVVYSSSSSLDAPVCSSLLGKCATAMIQLGAIHLSSCTTKLSVKMRRCATIVRGKIPLTISVRV